MEVRDFYTGLFWLIFSLITCFESFRLKLGDVNKPGPGFFPFWAGFVMGILSLIILYQSITDKERKGNSCQDEQKRWWNIILILGAITGYVLFLEKVGFIINTFLFTFLMLKVVEPQPWKKAILGAFVTSIAANVVFNVILKAQIPSGILGF